MSSTDAAQQLDEARRGRLVAALAAAEFDGWLAGSIANVRYGAGHQYAAAALGEPTGYALLVAGDDARLCAPISQYAVATGDAGRFAGRLCMFGTFYFEGADAPDPSESAGSLAEAVVAAVAELGLQRARIGHDADVPGDVLTALATAYPALRLIAANGWGEQVRSVKLAPEIELLERAAQLAEDGVARAIAAAAAGTTERQLMAIVGATMLEGGGLPAFLVVTSGPRSAFSDAYATDRPLAVGDLVRFDVGCTLDGYWSDIGRTAVVGEPDALQRERYVAILAGEQAQLDRARAGMPAAELFDLAVTTVEQHGLAPYRRHHCGHGIGLDVYERPIVNASTEQPLAAGMTLCVETPYYELGWGGMMVEDTIVVTDDGIRCLTRTSRELAVIAP